MSCRSLVHATVRAAAGALAALSIVLPAPLFGQGVALVGFYTNREHRSAAMIDPRELRGGNRRPARYGVHPTRAGTEPPSVRSFRDAVRAGERAWDEAAVLLERGTAGYRLIDIAVARGAGITPVRGRLHALLR